MKEPRFVRLDFERVAPEEMAARARQLLTSMWTRRSVRSFSTEPVDRELVETALRIASSAPSGAHAQPWTWVVISDPNLKRRLRAAAEEEERAFYTQRAPQEWLAALAPLGTDEVKSHLTDAPYVVVLFRHRYELTADGRRRRNYYSAESCGIAAGFFIAAVHLVGLATLPHTPSPMGFLARLLERPPNEEAFLVLPVGYPSPDARVPDIERKQLADVVVWRDGPAEVACGRPFEPPSASGLRLVGHFPERIPPGQGTVSGTVEVISEAGIRGVAAAAADVFLVHEGRVVTMPLPQDAMGIRWDLAPGESVTLEGLGSLRSCAPHGATLPPGDYDLHVRVLLTPDGATTPRAFSGGPWKLRVG